ncbi:MAG: S46 family peptidase [Bacteroidales bacterium]|jgi:V8-like Glu-specific endopeptidase|nr:S46 family peptidase [Bacteroidales bacterium]
MKKGIIITCLTLLSFQNFLQADEGMWIPIFLKYNEVEMQKMGFQLTAEDVYSVNSHSMKDAIVLFGGGCTAELISPEGLLVTNHHCGYSYVQSHSTLEHNYLHQGFWAKDKNEEISNPGLTVTFLVRMEDVTAVVLKALDNNISADKRAKIIQTRIDSLKKAAVSGTHYTAIIKPFFYGNQYFMFINETYRDVRLVGVPPENIGKFGGDTDNWMWPRHTGDFSLYRIYTAPDGTPADYSAENVPLKSKQYFPISIKGVEENDFTLVFGYPGTTQQFLTSDAVDITANVQNPIAIHQRGVRLDIMKKYMDQSTEIRLMYSAKANNISNGWKKWIGESKGIQACKVIDRKKQEEADFQNWANATPERKAMYGNVLEYFHQKYFPYREQITSLTYIGETFPAVELLGFLYSKFYPFIQKAQNSTLTKSQFEEAKEKMVESVTNFYGTYYQPIDKEIFVALLDYYFTTNNPQLIPAELQKYCQYKTADWQKLATALYDQSPFRNASSLIDFINTTSQKKIAKLDQHFAFQLIVPAYNQYFKVYEDRSRLNADITDNYRIYVKGLMEKDTQKVFYPDANLTMRVTYGKVQGFTPEDGKEYVYYTTIKGIMDKENPDVFDYKVDPKLKTLYNAHDYGRYANTKGEMPVAFIAGNHTTGGNSGSPVINGKGELIGINFDRVWEGTMSDINYDVSLCRNISLDARYMLFIIDKFANAQNIIQELEIVEGANTNH